MDSTTAFSAPEFTAIAKHVADWVPVELVSTFEPVMTARAREWFQDNVQEVA